NALNQHWRCHLTGPVAAAAAPCSGLGDFMGARGPSLALGPAVAFLVAWLLSDLPAALRPAVFGGDWPSRWLWGHMLIDAVVLTVLLVSGLRLLASDFTAALLVSLAYGLLIGRMDVWVFHITSPVLRDSVLTALSILIWALFLFLALAVALRIIRTSWLALWIGSLVAFQLSQVASTVIGVYGWGSSFVLFPPLREVVTMLAAATVFALVFWGGSRLMPAAASSS
ncbi:MAG TPA: hypothetical protein VEG08_02790, partial [Terriglobales bacterium]|nr:hypothetical protein [Terriglobales bacterium]